ncbi:MAG: hypothetical protein ACOYO1_03170 [Bacteroidales bacterium]
MKTIYYSEVQKVSNKWIWLLIATLFIIFSYGFIEELILQHPFEKNNIQIWTLGLLAILTLCLLLFVCIIKLSFQIDEDGIHFRFYPFHFKVYTIIWEDIETIHIRKYKPIIEYGGWGIRTISFTKNIAYNISGNIGLQIELKKGKKILIGTQNPEELEKIISKISSNK